MVNTWPTAKSTYYGHAGWMIALGGFLLAAPPIWYGPSWSYFSELPHNGYGMGVCCVLLGILQMVAIHGDKVRCTAVLLFLGGFVNWTAGIILFAEGILGHEGLMEAPFMCTVGAYKFIVSSTLTVHLRAQNRGG